MSEREERREKDGEKVYVNRGWADYVPHILKPNNKK